MSAEILRRAAALMRERAEAAMPGPWVRSGSSIETDHSCSLSHDCWPVADTYSGRKPDGSQQSPSRLRDDAEHIASWHPAVAIAVADWLDVHAGDLASSGGHLPSCDSPGDVEHALAVARAYLGEEASDA